MRKVEQLLTDAPELFTEDEVVIIGALVLLPSDKCRQLKRG